ncbi:hypothetical protein [Thiomicrorhabdus sp. Milos-T2]|uniref:hypothetical protein n=1 Tax=Thiomicrorhabdus sp. Milos-T2 TaxID=90814 RepID=UPI000493BFD0|nr:hypothetical protein [Thiomicrorhabdus sp. Milos-T2]
MNIAEADFEKLSFLIRVIEKEVKHLKYTSNKIFSVPLNDVHIKTLEDNPVFAEQLEAYTSRFCRLQDTLGDKLLPAWLEFLGESSRSVIDNLDKASKLGFTVDPDEWLVIRQLRNKMVHEYIEAEEVFLNALNFTHDYEENLFVFANEIIADLKARGIKENK